MKIIYIANVRMPTEKAHGIQIIKTCEALAQAGADLELWLPRRKNKAYENKDVFEFYGVKKIFVVKYFWSLDWISWLKFLPGTGFMLQSFTFTNSIKDHLKELPAGTIVYSRDFLPLKAASKAGLKYFYEAHTFSSHPRAYQLKILLGAEGIVAISKNLAEDLAKYLPAQKIAVVADGVDLSSFNNLPRKAAARLQLGFPADKKIILYAGHLYEWKGADILARAAESLPDNTIVYIVGGTAEDARKFKESMREHRLTRAKLLPQVAHQEIPTYLSAVDILVVPNSGKFEISRRHTSPLKLFEYMAAGRPVVASDLPSLREILDHDTAIFFQPDDPLSLAKKIKQMLDNPADAEILATRAAQKVRSYSWDARARKILEFLRSHSRFD